MKKRSARKLSLNAETLMVLDAGQIAGGITASITNCTTVTANFTNCTYCPGGTWFTCPRTGSDCGSCVSNCWDMCA